LARLHPKTSESSEWQRLRQLFKESPELEVSYQKAYSEHRAWSQLDEYPRDPILKGTFRILSS
jgi:hypothetical protein